jgi:hypothetical protein
MARASSMPAPPPSPFWQLPAFRWGVMAIGGLFLLTGMMWLEKLNRSYQLERRLEEDSRLGPMAAKLKAQIEHARRTGALKDSAKAAEGQVPQALWLGTVAAPSSSEPQDGSIVVLTGAHLIAGTAGAHDRGGQVRIGRRKFVFKGSRPRAGETWLISVWRDGPGNAIHSAARYAEAPGRTGS